MHDTLTISERRLLRLLSHGEPLFGTVSDQLGLTSGAAQSAVTQLVDHGHVTRIHQEDLAQAAGIDTRRNGRRAKYESHGGPSLLTAAQLLRDGAQDPDTQLSRLVGATVFTVLIGNSDAHAKNLSLMLDPPGAVQLAPLYDTVPTMLFPTLAVRCAMMIGGVYDDLEHVSRRALVYEVEGRRRWGLTGDRAATLVDEWTDRVVQAATDDRVGDHIHRAADRLAR